MVKPCGANKCEEEVAFPFMTATAVVVALLMPYSRQSLLLPKREAPFIHFPENWCHNHCCCQGEKSSLRIK